MSEFKTLFERLDNNVKEAIEKDREKFPSLVKALNERLQNTYFIGDTSLSDALSISTYAFGSSETFNVLKYYSLFETTKNIHLPPKRLS